MNNFKFIIAEEHINARLDVFLVQNVENSTRNSIQKLIENSNVLVNDKSIKKNYKLSVNDVITVDIKSTFEPTIEAENIELDVVFEDNDIVVINKPKGTVVHPAPGHYSGTLVNALMYHCKDSLSGINGEVRPGIVHRIDKDTTGLLVIAKNDYSHLSLSKQIQTHDAKRIYHAIVFGNIKNDEGTIDKPIGRHSTERKKMSVNATTYKNAVTNYRVLARYPGFTYIECSLKTGRTHQIRVHMQSIGHPIIGDFTYTNLKTKFAVNSQCLHAKELVLKHPKTNEVMAFNTELPEYFNKILKILDSQV